MIKLILPMIVLTFCSIARSLPSLYQMNHSHCCLSLPFVTLMFEHVRNRSTHIHALHLGPLTSACNWSQFDVVDDIVTYDILLDFIMMQLHYFVSVSA